MRTVGSVLVIGVALAITTAPLLGTSPLINYQGVLTDGSGTPLTGPYDLQFKLYGDSNQVATPLWDETHTGVPVNEGLFNVMLGGTEPFPDNLFDEQELWLGITVLPSTVEMTPRTRLTSVPWAFRTQVADSAVVAGGTVGPHSHHSLDAVDGYPVDEVYVDANGDVGIGTTTPAAKLHVFGLEARFEFYADGDFLRIAEPLSLGDGGRIQVDAGSELKGLEMRANPIVMMGGDVGIGTPYPSAMLDVQGTTATNQLKIAGGNTYIGVPFSLAHGGRIEATNDAGTELKGLELRASPTVMMGGDVGIGTPTPTYGLDVADTVQVVGFKMPTGASSGYLLTSDASGLGTWQEPATSGGDITSVTAGLGLTGGGTTGDVIIDVNPGEGLDVVSDTVRLNPSYSSGSAYDARFINEGQASSVTSAMVTDAELVDADIAIGAAIAPSKINGTAWTALTDGPGSGLDADLLDGLQAAAVSQPSPAHQSLDAADGTPADAVYVDNEGEVGIGTTNPAAKLDVAGTTQTHVLEITGGADLAEPFHIAGQESLDPGSVVVIDDANPGALTISTRSYDTRVAGVISGAGGIKTGLTLNQHGLVEGGQNVALSGRVYVRATTANGPIRPGDLLTTSAISGCAMKATDPLRSHGSILGKAMSGLAEGEDLVLVLVCLQ